MNYLCYLQSINQDNKLKPKQKEFLENLLTSSSIAEASRKTHINRNTGSKYYHDIVFQRAYSNAKAQMMKQTTTLLQRSTLQAVAVLLKSLHSNNEQIRLQSARTILSYAYSGYTEEQIITRLDKLEEQQNEI